MSEPIQRLYSVAILYQEVGAFKLFHRARVAVNTDEAIGWGICTQSRECPNSHPVIIHAQEMPILMDRELNPKE